MDYTLADHYVTHAGTGHRMHEDGTAIPTAVSEKDMNSLIWGLMEVILAAGQTPAQFDEGVPATYTVLLKAIKSMFAGNITALTVGSTGLTLTPDQCGLVTVNAAGGNIVINLPAANVVSGLKLEYRFVRSDSSANTVTVNAAAGNFIDGVGSFTLPNNYSYRTISANASATWYTSAITPPSTGGLKIVQTISATAAANAMTVTLPAGTSVDFRSATLSSGTVTTITNPAALNVVIPNGATLGTVNGQASRIMVLELNNVGSGELAVINLAGGVNLDETGLITTNAISNASNSKSVAYSTTARVGVPYRVLGFFDSTQTTAGQWANQPTVTQGVGGQAMTALSSLGYGQTYQNVSGSRAAGTTYYNTTGKPIILVITTSAGAPTTTVYLSVDGVQILQQSSTGTSGTYVLCVTAVIPPGSSYSFTGGGISTWFEFR